MAENNPTPQTAKPAAKPRNPVEKVIVRGFIAVMLVLVAVEANSWWQHKHAFEALSARTKAVDETPDAQAVTEADIKAYFQGKQPRTVPLEAGNNFTGASRIDVYSWFTISPVNKRDIYVYYGRATKDDKNGPEVLAIQVKDEAPPAPPQVAGGEQPSAGPPPGGGMMMPPGMQGGPGGGRRGRPGAGDGSAPSATDGEKTASDKPEGDQPAEDKSADDKPDQENTDKDQQ